MRKTIALAFLIMLVGLATTLLAGDTLAFKVEDPMGRNTVQFKTTAPLEDIVGVTNQVQGSIEVDPDALRGTRVEGVFVVDLASLKTGISLRDTHMRDQYLHTARYPKATFVLQRIKKGPQRLEPNHPVTLQVAGTFELHGVKRQIEVPVRVTYLPASESTMSKLPGNLLRVQTDFNVKLADYRIERPSMLVLKIGDTAHVSLDAFASDATPQQMSAWMEQMKKMMKGE